MTHVWGWEWGVSIVNTSQLCVTVCVFVKPLSSSVYKQPTPTLLKHLLLGISQARLPETALLDFCFWTTVQEAS